MVKDLVSKAAFEAGNKTVKLEYDPKIEDLEITFDPEKIERIVTNLISNAIKYTDSSGVILVKVLRRDENFILEVHDNGIGIRAEDRGTILSRMNGGQCHWTSKGNGHRPVSGKMFCLIPQRRRPGGKRGRSRQLFPRDSAN